ncbi:MAG: ParA family protein [candidate division Zixibacteria bacterium]|nr:ParA family protein [candidate division Zixibacteria bacterium]
MTRVIGIVNLKGGVGKTTTCVNLGAAIALRGARVLLIDLDPQKSLSTWAGVEEWPSVGEVLNDEVLLERAIVRWERAKCWVLPAGQDLRVKAGLFANRENREYLLKDKLDRLTGFDFVLIDSAPSYELLTINAICASTEIIVPLQTEILALESTIPFFETLGEIKSKYHPKLKIAGILPSMFDARTNLSKAILDQMRSSQHLGPLMFKTYIRKNIRLAETPAQGVAIMRYSTSNGAEDYRSLADELLNGWEPTSNKGGQADCTDKNESTDEPADGIINQPDNDNTEVAVNN